MRKSRVSEYKQHKLIEHFVAGATARCAGKLVNVNENKAINYLFMRIREIIAHQMAQESLDVFDGEIEEDQSFFEALKKGNDIGELLEKCQFLAF